VTLSLPTTSSGSYTLTATGTSGSLTHSTALALRISPAQNFNIALSPDSITTNAGMSNSTFTASITGQNGFMGCALPAPIVLKRPTGALRELPAGDGYLVALCVRGKGWGLSSLRNSHVFENNGRRWPQSYECHIKFNED
jgi:hypothetical protein